MEAIKPIIVIGLLFLGIKYAHGQKTALPKPAKDTTFPHIDSLKAAIVTATVRPHLKGDTIEYNTDHIPVPSNAMVEELLRRLPGLQIDPDGTITYNGEKIQRLLVNGEDIFASDPTMVTRNFDATKIAKVQILDRKTDGAIFTGIDDGIRTKTINLVLKTSAQNGYFGKIEAGGNSDQLYNAGGAVAGFKDKEQITLLGIITNIGTTSFSNSSNGTKVGLTNESQDPLGASAGFGVPRFNGIAAHYADTWNASAGHLSANYQYSQFFSQPKTNTQTFQTQTDSIYSQNQQAHSANMQDQHWFYAIYDWSPSRITAFNLSVHAINFSVQNQYGATDSSKFNETIVNSESRVIQDKISRQDFSVDLFGRVKIGKEANQNLSIQLGIAKVDDNTVGYLYSIDRYYGSNGFLQTADTLDQRKEFISHSIDVHTSLNYTHPLWQNTILGISYTIDHKENDPLQGTYARGDGKYTLQIDSLSSYFKTVTNTEYALINLQGTVPHFSYDIGNTWHEYNYYQHSQIHDTSTVLHYLNWSPKILLTYTPNSATNFNLHYDASSQDPSSSQVIPTENNNDPLHLYIGNTNLKPAINQNFKLDFHRFRAWLIDLSLNLSFNNNNISTRTTTDSLGRQISQPVNVNGGKTASFNFSLSRKLLGLDIGLHAREAFSRTFNYINSDLSNNNSYSGGGGV